MDQCCNVFKISWECAAHLRFDFSLINIGHSRDGSFVLITYRYFIKRFVEVALLRRRNGLLATCFLVLGFGVLSPGGATVNILSRLGAVFDSPASICLLA